ASPNFSQINDLSLKDGSRLSAGFIQSQIPGLGDPLTEVPTSLGQHADLSNFQAAHPGTMDAMGNVIENKPVTTKLGRTFDTTNPVHTNHLNDWYVKNQVTNKGIDEGSLRQFVTNPANSN